MNSEKINRINELARKQRESSLTDEELLEQKNLREEYLRDFREGFKAQLEAIKIQEPDGTIRDLKRKE